MDDIRDDFDRELEVEFKNSVLTIEDRNIKHYRSWSLLSSARTGLLCDCGYCWSCKSKNELLDRGYTTDDILTGNHGGLKPVLGES